MDHGRMMTLIVLGFVIEALGLSLAAHGLWRTWKANADGRDFLPQPARRAVNWVRFTVLRRPRPTITGHLGAVLPSVEVALHGHVRQDFREGMTTEEKVEVAQANALSALRAASQAQSQLDEEGRTRQAQVVNLSERIDSTDAKSTAFARGLVVEGVPQAVVGLAMTGVGLLLQTIASAMGVS